MMSAPRRPARAGFGTARDIATRMPAATSLRIVDPRPVGVTPEFVVNLISCSFRMGQGESLVYALVARAASPRRSRSAAIFMRVDATYGASVKRNGALGHLQRHLRCAFRRLLYGFLALSRFLSVPLR